MKFKDEVITLEENLRDYENTIFHLLAVVNQINKSIDDLDLIIPNNLEYLVECLFTEIAYVDTDIREAIGDDIYEESN